MASGNFSVSVIIKVDGYVNNGSVHNTIFSFGNTDSISNDGFSISMTSSTMLVTRIRAAGADNGISLAIPTSQ